LKGKERAKCSIFDYQKLNKTNMAKLKNKNKIKIIKISFPISNFIRK